MHHSSMRGMVPRLSLTRTFVLPPLPLHRFRAHRLPTSTSKPFSLSYPRLAPTMDDNVKQHYLADSPPTVVRLEIKSHFDSLQDDGLRKYAHYMSRYGAFLARGQPWNCNSPTVMKFELTLDRICIGLPLRVLVSLCARFHLNLNLSTISFSPFTALVGATGAAWPRRPKSAMNISATFSSTLLNSWAIAATTKGLVIPSSSPVFRPRLWKLWHRRHRRRKQPSRRQTVLEVASMRPARSP